MIRSPQSRRLAMLGVALLCAGCGPASTLLVSVRDVQQDVKFGGPPASPAPFVAPPPASSLVLGSPPILGGPIPYQPAFGVALGPATPAAPTPAVTSCPTNRYGAAGIPAPDHSDKPPVPGTYGFRQAGAWNAGGTGGALPAATTRDVGVSFTPQGTAGAPPPPGSATSEWTVSEYTTDAHGWLSQTTTTYGLYPGSNPSDPTAPPSMQYGQIAIGEINTTYASGPNFGTADDFIPSTPLTVIQFPVTVGNPWKVHAVDRNASHVGARAVQVGAGVEGMEPVLACHENIEAWHVAFIKDYSGMLSTPGNPCYVLNGYYDVATQLDLIVAEHTEVTVGTSAANGCNTTPPVAASTRDTVINSPNP